jgi:hypothetical protein
MARNRKAKNKPPILENFMQQVALEQGGIKTLINPKGEISMSDAISQLIEPYRDDAPNYNSFHNLVGLACVAWNISILSPKEQAAALKDMLTAIPFNRGEQHIALDLIKEMMKRKQRLFPQVSRMIIEHKVTDLGNDFHIAIASTMEKK